MLSVLSCSWHFLCILAVCATSPHLPGARASHTPLFLQTPLLAHFTSSTFHSTRFQFWSCTSQPLSKPHRCLQGALADRPCGNLHVALSLDGLVALPSRAARSLSRDHWVEFGSLWYLGGELDEPWTCLAFRALCQICLLGGCSVSRDRAQELCSASSFRGTTCCLISKILPNLKGKKGRKKDASLVRVSSCPHAYSYLALQPSHPGSACENTGVLVLHRLSGAGV